MKKFLLTVFFIAFGWIMLPQTADAAIVQKQVDRDYQVSADSVKITEKVTATVTNPDFLVAAGSEEVFILFDPELNDPDFQAKIDKALPTVRVTDASGNPLNFTTELDGQNMLIKVKRTKNLLYNQPNVMIFSYDSFALINKAGAIYDLYIPSFAENYKFVTDTTETTVTTAVHVPKSLGELNFVLPSQQPQDEGDNWKINFSQAQLTGKVSWIQIGTKQYYSFDITQPYTSTTRVPIFFNTYTILLPRDIDAGDATQKVYFSEITPAPDVVDLDADGNLVAKFSIPANSNGEIHIRGYVETETTHAIDIAKSGTLTDVPAKLAGSLSPATFWEANAPEIQQQAAEIKGESTDIYDLITKTYSFVVNRIDYSEVKRFGLNERQGALKTLQGGAAVCMEYSDLFIALMRAEGVPARAALGYGYDSRSGNVSDISHQWAEVYLPAYNKWLAVDTTWGESGTAAIGGNLNHLYKYVASQQPDNPAPVAAAYFGNLNAIPDDHFQITALAELPSGENLNDQSALLATYSSVSATNSPMGIVFKNIFRVLSSIDMGFANTLTTLGLTSPLIEIVRIVVYTLILLPVALVIFKRGGQLVAKLSHKRTKVVESKMNPVS